MWWRWDQTYWQEYPDFDQFLRHALVAAAKRIPDIEDWDGIWVHAHIGPPRDI